MMPFPIVKSIYSIKSELLTINQQKTCDYLRANLIEFYTFDPFSLIKGRMVRM